MEILYSCTQAIHSFISFGMDVMEIRAKFWSQVSINLFICVCVNKSVTDVTTQGG